MQSLCVVEGCSAPRAAGWRLCNRHGLNVKRYGHPESPLEKRKEEFLEAALAHPEAASSEPLAVAAVRYIGERMRGRARSTHALRMLLSPALVMTMLDCREVRRLGTAARGYADFPAELPQEAFEEQLIRLEDAAEALFFAVPLPTADALAVAA